MHVNLDKWCVANAVEAVDLSSLDDKNVTCTGFELFSVDDPEAAPFPHELDFIVRMTMEARAASGEGAEEEHRDIHVTVVGSNELMRAALKGQVLLPNAEHAIDSLMG
jgi:hypothetical protein